MKLTEALTASAAGAPVKSAEHARRRADVAAPPAGAQRRWSVSKLALSAALASAAVALLVPNWTGGLRMAAGVCAIVATAVLGRRRRLQVIVERGARAWDPWWLMAVGLLALTGRGAINVVTTDVVLRSSGDVIAILGYPCIIIGLVRLAGERLRERPFDTLLVAAIAPLAVGVVFAVLLPERLVQAPDDLVRVSLGIVLVVADALAVALTGRLALVTSGQPGPARSLMVAFSCLLGAHISQTAAMITGLADDPFGSGALLVMAYGLIAAAALHPSVRTPDDMPPTVVPVGPARMALFVAAVLLGPAIMFREQGRGGWELFAAAASVVFSLLVVSHLTRLARERTVLEHHALHDDLTGLPNRVLFLDRLSLAVRRAQRRNELLAVMFVDLDRFKTVNDSLGHAAGNDLLRATASRLRERVRDGDTVARVGGDEFCIVLPELADPGDATAMAAKILESFAVPFTIEGRTLFVSPSLGVAIFPGHGVDAEELLRNADAAMYRAKERGRNTVEVYTEELTVRARERLSLETNLHSAIEGGQLTLHYQPKVDVRTERIVGVEALVRWQHPQLGLVPPGTFIELAEETGLIVPLGEWVLETACRQARAWDDAGLPSLTVAVNLSARQFRHQPVADMVADVLRRTGLPARRLELELTESLALEDTESVTAALDDLHRMGVHCSIDDFGTGYSALCYLTRFPIDTLKIDKGFVRRIDGASNDSAIVRGVIALAHSLNLDVVAEGVETAEQSLFLRENGCDLMQGYLFSRPVPASELEALLGGAPVLLSQARLAPVAALSTAPESVAAEPASLGETPASALSENGGASEGAGTFPGRPSGRPAGRRCMRRAGAIGMIAAMPLVVGLGSAQALPGEIQVVANHVLAAVHKVVPGPGPELTRMRENSAPAADGPGGSADAAPRDTTPPRAADPVDRSDSPLGIPAASEPVDQPEGLGGPAPRGARAPAAAGVDGPARRGAPAPAADPVNRPDSPRGDPAPPEAGGVVKHSSSARSRQDGGSEIGRAVSAAGGPVSRTPGSDAEQAALPETTA